MKILREVRIEGCELIGSGASGDVYRIDDDTVVKVYRNPGSLAEIEQEQNLSRLAFVSGISQRHSQRGVQARRFASSEGRVYVMA